MARSGAGTGQAPKHGVSGVVDENGRQRGSGTRDALQMMVDEGYLTAAEADEAAETIDLVTSLVDLGGMTLDHASQVIDDLAREKADAWHERTQARETRKVS